MSMELVPSVSQFLSWEKAKSKGCLAALCSWLPKICPTLGNPILGQTLDTPQCPRASQESDWATNPCGTYWKKWGKKEGKWGKKEGEMGKKRRENGEKREENPPTTCCDLLGGLLTQGRVRWVLVPPVPPVTSQFPVGIQVSIPDLAGPGGLPGVPKPPSHNSWD